MKSEWCGSCGNWTAHLGETCLQCMPVEDEDVLSLIKKIEARRQPSPNQLTLHIDGTAGDILADAILNDDPGDENAA